MKPLFTLIAVCLFSALSIAALAAPLKPRIVVLTDIGPANVEPDDNESMVRFCAYADRFEIDGIICGSGWNSSSHPYPPSWMDFAKATIDAYEKDATNLLKRSGQTSFRVDESKQELGYWPSADYLRSRTMLGSPKLGFKELGDNNNSAGSDFLIKLADEKDDRPIWVCLWGGANTFAQAVWRVQQERTPEQLRAFLHKFRVYAITDQDRNWGKDVPFEISSQQWLRREFGKDLLFIWDESAWLYQCGAGKAKWSEYEAGIQGHGHLGSVYPKYKYGVEGDTPSFLYVMPNGLNDPDRPDFGGWGGYFEWGTGPDGATLSYVNQPGTPASSISRKYETRFYPAIFNDFAARMSWAKDGAGNRNPVVIVNGDTGIAPIKLTPVEGDSVTLDASASKDPDGDTLKFSWWVFSEAGTCTNKVAISGGDTSHATITVPPDAAGKSIHVICEVTDAGTPHLTSYRRIILEPTGVAKGPQPPKPSASAKPRVIVTSDFPPLDVIPGGAGYGPPEKRSDPDDVQSMVRFLVYANEFDVEGLVASAGTYANIARKQNILDILNLYDQVDESLRKHDSRYPTADQLRAVTRQGRDNTWGKPAAEIIGEGRDSEASEAIIEIVDRPDPRPVWVCVWGGPCEVAQAIWKVQKTRTPAELEKFVSKLRIFMIGLGDRKTGQDGSGQWMLDTFPNLFVIVSQKTYGGMFAGNSPIGNLDWINANVREGRGPLGAVYPPSGFNPEHPGMKEGDTPSFMYLYSAMRGINDPEKPDQESWGGQYAQRDPAKKHWYDGPGETSVSKWLPEMQRNFASRMNWCIANHLSHD